MRRTELLQEIRTMRFEEAFARWQERRLTQEEAACLLGVHERTFRRYIDRYEEEGPAGLADKRLSQVSHRCAPVDEVVRLETVTGSAMTAGTSNTFTAFTRPSTVASAATLGSRAGCRRLVWSPRLRPRASIAASANPYRCPLVSA